MQVRIDEVIAVDWNVCKTLTGCKSSLEQSPTNVFCPQGAAVKPWWRHHINNPLSVISITNEWPGFRGFGSPFHSTSLSLYVKFSWNLQQPLRIQKMTRHSSQNIKFIEIHTIKDNLPWLLVFCSMAVSKITPPCRIHRTVYSIVSIKFRFRTLLVSGVQLHKAIFAANMWHLHCAVVEV